MYVVQTPGLVKGICFAVIATVLNMRDAGAIQVEPESNRISLVPAENVLLTNTVAVLDSSQL